MKGEDQQNQYLCWVRNGEMNMQLKERFVDSLNESSWATSPTSRVYTHIHTRAHTRSSSSSVRLSRNWNLPGTLPFCSPASSPGFLQEV